MIYGPGGEPLYLGVYLGTVTDNADPEKLARVRVVIHGLIEPSTPWAFPIGGGHSSGAKSLGTYDVPPIGAAVAVMFHAGDPDRPLYFGGWHGQTEQFSVVPSAPADADKVKVFESDRFLIVLNGIGGSEEVLVRDKVSGDSVSMKPAQLKITSATKVTVDCPMIELGADGLGAAPLLNGVVLASGIEPLTGKTYGVLQSASNKVTASK